MLSGCLVEDPPEYTAPTRTPPRLNLTQTEPPIDQVWVTQVNEIVPFKIGVSSEDDGVALRGYLLVDYPGGVDWPSWAANSVPASTLDDPNPRDLIFKPSVKEELFGRDAAIGCHRITLRVAHIDNFNYDLVPLVLNPRDVAEAHWWFNVIDPSSGQDGSVLTGCPTASKDDP
jgi:hypothetical protein